jgi:type VI secretion system protein ImpA
MILSCRDSLSTIRRAFDEGTDYQYSPDFELLQSMLGQLQKFAEVARPELAATTGDAADGAEGAAEGDGSEDAGDGSAQRAAPRVARADIVATEIVSQKAAAAALLAAEQYFGREEPSSPALILVHQARTLVGRSLVEAIEALMPTQAEMASIVVDANFGFEFTMAAMKTITEDYSANAVASDDSEAETPVFTIRTREEAIAAIYGVSAFFRASEPSSPIPMLLGKADKFLNQSFLAIVADLMPKKTSD